MSEQSSSGTKRGLHEKYEVYKDGEAVEDCFVLEPESDSAALRAIIAYARATENESLEEDLREWSRSILKKMEESQ